MPVSSLLNGRDSAVHHAYTVRRNDDRAHAGLASCSRGASSSYRLHASSSSSGSTSDRSDILTWDTTSPSFKQTTSLPSSTTFTSTMSRARTVPSRRLEYDSSVPQSSNSSLASPSSTPRVRAKLTKRSAGSLKLSLFAHAVPRPDLEVFGAAPAIHRRRPSSPDSPPHLPITHKTPSRHHHSSSIELESPTLSSSSSATSTSPPLTPRAPHSQSLENVSDVFDSSGDHEDLAARFLEMSLPASKRSPSTSFSRLQNKSRSGALPSKAFNDPLGELGENRLDVLFEKSFANDVKPGYHVSGKVVFVEEESSEDDEIFDLSAPVMSTSQPFARHQSLSEAHQRRRRHSQRAEPQEKWISLNAWMPAVKAPASRYNACLARSPESLTCIRIPHAPDGYSYVVKSFSLTSPQAGCSALSTWFDPTSEDGQGSVSFFPHPSPTSDKSGGRMLEGTCTFKPTTYFSMNGAKAVPTPVPCKILTPFTTSASPSSPISSSSIRAPGLKCTLTRGIAPFVTTGSGMNFPEEIHRMMGDEPSDFGILLPEMQESSTVYVIKLVPDSPQNEYARFSYARGHSDICALRRPSFMPAPDSSDSTSFVWALTLSPSSRSS